MPTIAWRTPLAAAKQYQVPLHITYRETAPQHRRPCDWENADIAMKVSGLYAAMQ